MRALRFTCWAVAATVAAVPALRAQGAPPAPAPSAGQAAAPAQPPSVCGSTPNCVETNDFAAVITNFRTSDLRGYKMIDVVMHFQNKTANQLVLGYLQNSGTIIDDKGNRYVVWGANGVRGIGQVYGGSFDPKFTLGPSGTGDAQFELAWYPGQQIYGFSFAFDLTIDEINSYQGNQHSLGGEFPLHFQGLANGIATGGGQMASAGAAMGAASSAGGGGGAGDVSAAGAGQPCANGGAAGTATAAANATGSQAVQGAAAQGASAVSTAASAVQSVASIFSKKKNPPAKPAGSPCGSAAAATGQSATGAAASNAVASTPKTTTANATAAKTTTAPPAKAATVTTAKVAAPATAPVPVSAPVRTGTKKTVTPDTLKHP